MVEREIEIRPAEPGDALGIARTQVETWRDAYVGILREQSLINLDEMRATVFWTRVIGQMTGYEHISVAEHEGVIVGFCNAGPARAGLIQAAERFAGGDPSWSASTLGEIYALYVDPNFQQMGIGRALLCDGVRALISDRVERLGLMTLAANDHARRFYEAVGGVPGDTHPSVVSGEPADQVAYMWQDLAALVRELETVSP